MNSELRKLLLKVSINFHYGEGGVCSGREKVNVACETSIKSNPLTKVGSGN